jgi:hypothetical protein
MLERPVIPDKYKIHGKISPELLQDGNLNKNLVVAEL